MNVRMFMPMAVKGMFMAKKIVLLIAALIGLVILAGIYRFNFTDDDLYVVQQDGTVVPLNEDRDNVILTLFSIKTHKHWVIQLPESDAEAQLTRVGLGDSPFVSGDYQDGPERGSVNLDYQKILPINGAGIDASKNMLFVAPFFVSNQGSGVFCYLGLFSLNHQSGEIKQLGTHLLGDRIEIKSLTIDEPFDVTSSLVVSYLTHGDEQSMAQQPAKVMQESIKVSDKGFEAD